MNKRQRTQNLSREGNDVAVEMDTFVQSEDESWSTRALRVEVILRKIFLYLPTEVLLFACSLVNKVWNREARVVVRDYRKCRINKREAWFQSVGRKLPMGVRGVKMECTVLELLEGYDKICGKIIQSGRVVPFNYMVVPEYSCRDWRNECRPNESVFKNITGGMKIKHLEFLGNVKVNCACGRVIVRLLTQTCSDVRSIVIRAGCRTFVNLKTCGWVPAFPKLEELDISWVGMFCPPAKRDKEMLEWLLNNAVHLKSVRVKSWVGALGILPDEMFSQLKLRGSLNIDISTTMDLKLLHRVCALQCELYELNIFQPPWCFHQDALIVNVYILTEFQKCVEVMLQNSDKTVETLRIIDGCVLASVSFPPLCKLSYLRLEDIFHRHDALWKIVLGIEFGSKMPVLVKVYLGVKVDYESIYGSVVHAATSVRSLRICFGSKVTNIWPLPILFPNISKLDCSLMGRGNMVTDIFKHWHHLLDLRLSFDWIRRGKRNYDMDFCGVHPEEAEILRQQDSVYLASVHVVPIRPCLVTMPNLRSISIRDSYSCEDDSVVLMSKVTRLIALDRMVGADVCYTTPAI